jgi:hypothetical protein
MFVAGDEDRSIRMYKFEAPTKEYTFVKSWDFSANLGVTDIDKKTGTAREVDIEALVAARKRHESHCYPRNLVRFMVLNL